MECRLTICENVPEERDYILSLAKAWGRARGHLVHTTAYASAEAFLFQDPSAQEADLLLLDIEMGEMDGVTLARLVREKNELVQIVFITGYTDYIAEGYEVQALHYLLKPVDEGKLFSVLDRAADRLRRNERILTLKTADGTVRVLLHEISYIEVLSNYVTVHAKEALRVKRTLGEIERELDERFFRVGRSFIVNLTMIHRVTRQEIHLSTGAVIPLPRGQYEAVNRALIERM